ncbi:hypothetical protein EIN_521650 [Entamoeba invadens IP1]|uniref:Uncharacterized protein n=1 Tax=Entamoeba invadens IP1 TaxID=370355 RepID=A0A0A1UFL8_ENTIV|nr:hypothetical protein EIN_521650 [Entamoeba invadens IP1]ELP91738.1 hypothetical protein EIN_521650 [Entamoeba invadens IP1]|eukprot:XP_004258509.1 hypothetical protein EIN_521650 [Entamoeba invadens IP1]
MISIVLITFVAQAEYFMITNNEYMNVYLLDKCYYSGGNTYTKYVKEGNKAKVYGSVTCGNWVDQDPIELDSDQSFVENLPEYAAVSYAYIDAKDCKIKESDARPIETLIKIGCVKTSETTSTKTEIKDGKFIKNDFDTSAICGGLPSKIINKELGKCFTDEEGLFNIIKDSTMTLSMCFALVIAFF